MTEPVQLDLFAPNPIPHEILSRMAGYCPGCRTSHGGQTFQPVRGVWAYWCDDCATGAA